MTGECVDGLEVAVRAAVARFVAEIRLHDRATGAHVDSIGAVAGVVARGLAEDGRIDDWTAAWIERVAPLHDVGKLDVPASVLEKPTGLDADEWAIVRRHPTAGRDRVTGILDRVVADLTTPADTDSTDQIARVIDLTASVVELHHETLDGRGYPHGLTDDEIPVGARVVAVADVYDALTAARPYKDPWSAQQAVGELSRMVDDGRLDGDCVAVLARSTEELDDLAGRAPRGGPDAPSRR